MEVDGWDESWISHKFKVNNWDGNRIAVFDPGMTTGVVTVDSEGNGIGGQLGFLDVCALAYRQPPHTMFLAESFKITSRTAKVGDGGWSLEVIGVLRFISQDRLKLQSPTEGKAFASDQKLKAIEWWAPGQKHLNDALRHLLVHSVKKQWWDERLTND